MNIDVSKQPLVRDQYDIIGRLGSGTYGVVYMAKRKGTNGPFVAVKIILPQKEGKTDCLTTISQLREIKIIKELKNDHIVKELEVFYNYPKRELGVVYEYADYDLHDLVESFQNARQSIPVPVIRNIMWQLLNAVAYLHSNWIMHRDIKPTNILIFDNSMHSGLIKVTDFGLARSFQEPIIAFSELERVVVTLWYRAPELLLGCKTYGPAIDMWAVGCVLARMINLKDLFCGDEVRSLSEKHPFQSNQCERIFSILGLPSIYDWPELKSYEHYPKISRWGFDKRLSSSSSLRSCIRCSNRDLEMIDLLTQLLTVNPNNRITARDALQHPFFTEHAHELSLDSLPAKEHRDFPTPQKHMDGVKIESHLVHSPSSGIQLQVGNEDGLFCTPK